MRKVLLLTIALLALVPTLRYPVLGQKPSSREKSAVKQPNRKTGGNQTGNTDQRGTKESPLIVDAEGHQQTEYEKKQAAEEKQRARYIESRTLWYLELTAWSTAILVGVGLIASIAAFCTLRAIQRQADLQERAIRPWVGATSVSRGSVISQSNKPQVGARITLRNTGPSVALKGFMLPFLISSKHDVLPGAIKGSWEMMETVLKSNPGHNTGFVLHPGGKHHQNAYMGPATDISMDEITNGTYYILVCVEYRDQFDRPHRTQDCFRIVTEPKPSVNVRFDAVPAYQIAE